ncbi:heme acquisition protein HasA [Achromobacter ruhlandii]|uniref:heme acquisition protein HasA n=1 Tax=Achromobacter ruhlandii TaxID=72557 RepID=UPI003BA0CE8D
MSAQVSFIDISHLPTGITTESSLELMLDAFQNGGVAGEHTSVPNKGGFFGGNAFNGTDYGYVSKTVANYAFVASGDLHYFFPPYSGHAGDGPTAHTVWGSLDSITLGGGLDGAGHVVDPLITFAFDQPIEGDVADGRGNEVHDIVWGLMNGSVVGTPDKISHITNGGLVDALEQNGMDMHTSIADLVAHNFATETDLALAA